MNIFEVLKRDHRTVSALFENIDRTSNKAISTREELFNQLRLELTIHMELEEKLFYSALSEHESTCHLLPEAIEEHNRVKELLDELQMMSKDGDEWIRQIFVLKYNVDHHVEEEETEMFDKARKVLSMEQIQEMAISMKIEKDKLLPIMNGFR